MNAEEELRKALEHLANVDRIIASLPEDHLHVPGIPPPATLAKLNAALAELHALLELVPVGTALMPGATNPRLTRPNIEREWTRWRMLARGQGPPCSVEKRAFDAHAEWRNGRGGKRIELRRACLVRESYTRADFANAVFEDADLSRIRLTSSEFTEAQIVRCVLADASIRHTVFTRATITDSDLSRASIQWSGFSHARIAGTKLSGVDMGNCVLADVVARHCDFTGAKLREVSFDNGRFESCVFRGADLSRRSSMEQAPTAKNAHFVDCDFTDADVGERDFSGARFVRCKLGALVPNIARSIEGVVLEDCDVDREAFAKRVGPPPMPPAGVVARYRLEAEMSSSDLKARWPISTIVELDHPPTEDEAKKLLDADALATLAANGGEGCDYSVYYVVIKLA